MKRNQYCILNRQYSPDEYKKMVEKIAAHMVETGEWGSFFPAAMSPFPFRETVAEELFPLSDEECTARGYNFDAPLLCKDEQRNDETMPNCKSCGRNFRIVSQEENFYRNMMVNPPEICPDCRHRNRMKRRRPMELHESVCVNCLRSIPTSAPKGAVLCEQCFSVRD